VIQNAISSATRDPRFPPVRRDELDDLDVKVDVLGEPELVHSLDELDPKRYGLIVQSKKQSWKRGLCCLTWRVLNTVEKQGVLDPLSQGRHR